MTDPHTICQQIETAYEAMNYAATEIAANVAFGTHLPDDAVDRFRFYFDRIRTLSDSDEYRALEAETTMTLEDLL